MEASTATLAPPAEPSVHDNETTAEAVRLTEELFQWHGYVHVGSGAESCDARHDGSCVDPKHFHGWTCLPNAFQVRDISEKGQAARARKIRAMKERDSDSWVNLEAGLDEVREGDRETLIQEIAERDAGQDFGRIVAEISSREEFALHAQHAEESRRLSQIPEEERDAEEFDQVEKHVQEYADALDTEVKKAIAKHANALRGVGEDKLIDIVRRSRIEQAATEVQLHTYYMWMMFACTYRPTTQGFPTQRIWSDVRELKSQPPEVVAAVRAKLNDLELRMSRGGGAAGNS